MPAWGRRGPLLSVRARRVVLHPDPPTEFQFYLVSPLIVLTWHRRRRWGPVMMAFLVALSLGLRWAMSKIIEARLPGSVGNPYMTGSTLITDKMYAPLATQP